jgi:NADH-quinone oxidoreductase subunit B
MPGRERQLPEIPPDLVGTVHLTPIDRIYNWARKRSLWPLFFGLACCAIEMIAAADPRFDFSRFGMEIMRASPRQADLMMITGTVTKKMVPQIVRIYNQMPEPKYVLAMGACAISGGPFKEGYNVVSGIDKFLPVDVYVPGCPPRPEALMHGFLSIHARMERESIRDLRWYREGGHEGCVSVPEVGPDLVDWRLSEQVRSLSQQSTE